MKKLIGLVVGTMLLSMPVISQTAKVSPNPLRIVGDSVVFKANLYVPADKVMKNAGNYVVMPELGESKFPEIRIPSSRLANAHKVGISVTVRSAMKFNEDMIGNSLEIEHEYEYGSEMSKNKEFGDLDNLGACCITTGRLYVMDSQYNLQKYKLVKGERMPYKIVAQFNFPQDVSKLSANAYNAEVDAIGKYLKKYPNSTITVRGFASPEGTYERNTKLAQERADAAKTWLINQLNKKGYKNNFKAQNIRIETTVEDWNGFKSTLANSDMSKANQDSIRKIISHSTNPAETETAVIDLVGSVQKAEEYLKPLRRATVVVENEKATRAGYSPEQVDSVMTLYNEDKIAESSLKDIFNTNEYLYASQKTDATEGKISLLAAYYQKGPEDYRAYSDLGAMTMVNTKNLDIIGGDDAIIGTGFNREEWDLDGEVDFDKSKIKIKQKAKREDVEGLDMKAKTKVDFKDGESLLIQAYEINSKDPVVLNNLGAYYLAEEEFTKARDYLTASHKAEENAGTNYNLGLYYGRMGDYQKSLQYFNKANDVEGMQYNRAITKLMLDDVAGARADLQTILNKQASHMLANYAMAIVGARMNDMALISKHLPIAIKQSENKSLSDATQENLEFRNFFNDERFKMAADDDPK